MCRRKVLNRWSLCFSASVVNLMVCRKTTYRLVDIYPLLPALTFQRVELLLLIFSVTATLLLKIVTGYL